MPGNGHVKRREGMTAAITGGIARLTYGLIPVSVRQRAVSTMFQPSAGSSLAARIVRRWHDRQHEMLTEEGRQQCVQQFWEGDAGSRWIESKRQRYQQGAVLLLEDARDDFARSEISESTGGLGSSHNYPALFREAGYTVQRMDVRQLDGSSPDIRFVYAIASFAQREHLAMVTP